MACIAAIGVHTTQYINVILTFRDCSLWARLPVAKCSTHVRHGVHGQRNFVGVHCRLCWRRLAHTQWGHIMLAGNGRWAQGCSVVADAADTKTAAKEASKSSQPKSQ